MTRVLGRLRAGLLGALGVLLVAALWDLYKAFGPEQGVLVGERTLILPRATDLAMPHTWEMVRRLFEPATGLRGAPTALEAVLDASAFTLSIAARGWLVGVVVGIALALLMTRFKIAEAGMLPWIVLSQTVPLIAIAPLVRRWGAQIEFGSFTWENEHSVALIAAYLAFFPVAVGGLRGLKSPARTHVELMHTYGVGWWRTLITLRLPASVPFLLPALRLAAASAVIGSVVAEVSIGLRGGIGRMVVEYAQSAGGDPAKAWAPIFGAVAVGLVAAGAVGLLTLALRPFHLTETIR
ncbi:MAG: transporter permease [Nocardioides sp.]|nr:transporter permease [Nocardioides sp.]